MLFGPSDIKLPEKGHAGKGGAKPRPEQMGEAKNNLPHQVRIIRSGRLSQRRALASEIKTDTLRAELTDFNPGDQAVLVSGKSWNTPNIFEAMLDITGPAELWLTTYSITDDVVRFVSTLKNDGKLTGVYALLNSHMAGCRPEGSSHMAQICSRMMVYPVHAKVYAVRGAEHGLVFYGSSNATRCPLLEAGILSHDTELTDWTIDWIGKALDLAEPFALDAMSDTLKRKTKRFIDENEP